MRGDRTEARAGTPQSTDFACYSFGDGRTAKNGTMLPGALQARPGAFGNTSALLLRDTGEDRKDGILEDAQAIQVWLRVGPETNVPGFKLL